MNSRKRTPTTAGRGRALRWVAAWVCIISGPAMLSGAALAAEPGAAAGAAAEPPAARQPAARQPLTKPGAAVGTMKRLDPKGADAPLRMPEVAGEDAEQAPITAETMATAEKPKGFRYRIIRGGIIDDIDANTIYVKRKPDSERTTAVPIPKDRELLATCIEGGKLEDLKRNTTAEFRYDPRGVVRPKITIESVPELQRIENAKIIALMGATLYYNKADGEKKGLKIEGGYEQWDEVVTNGTKELLRPGVFIDLTWDPGGEEKTQITLRDPAKAKEIAARFEAGAHSAEGQGCGCKVSGGGRGGPGRGALGFLAGLAIVFMAVRRRHA